ncbi:hypothetical protein [Sorangium sp. So ce1078]|uniref:hypothetical protein n=1 Tax=Sorangium sp. So ce1078 TaxID=3133329 RepID=UPI003F5ECAFA
MNKQASLLNRIVTRASSWIISNTQAMSVFSTKTTPTANPTASIDVDGSSYGACIGGVT